MTQSQSNALANNKPEPILSTKQICELTGCNRVTVWRMVRDGRFPAPIQITGNKIGWLQSDYQDWLAEQVARRDGKQLGGRS